MIFFFFFEDLVEEIPSLSSDIACEPLKFLPAIALALHEVNKQECLANVSKEMCEENYCLAEL